MISDWYANIVVMTIKVQATKCIYMINIFDEAEMLFCRVKKELSTCVVLTGADPKRPWRTHSSKEKLLRIDNELKRHHEKASEVITPLPDCDMTDLVKECQQEGRESSGVGADRLRDTVNAAKRIFPTSSTGKSITPQPLLFYQMHMTQSLKMFLHKITLSCYTY